jgi:hypothetical protein
MYTLIVIVLGIWTLIIVGGFYRKYRKERSRVKLWLASQPPEILISGRKRAAERARALIQDQIDCDTFIEELGKSQDPEIQKLLRIVVNMSVEDDDFRRDFKDSIEKRILILESTTVEEKIPTPDTSVNR